MGVIEGSVQRGAGVERGPGAAFYADANNGSNSNSGGSWGSAKLTIAAALALMSEGDTLYLSGKFREQVTLSNLLGGVSIIGADDRLPAHADSPWPSGASWLPPASGVTSNTALLTIRSQGVTVKNILFDAHSDSAGIELERNALSGDSEFDASHANIVNCRFTSGDAGIESDGGASFVIVEDCRFYDLVNGIKSLSTSVANPLRWVIRGSVFQNNTNHVVMPFSDAVIKDNVFGAFTTLALDISGGAGANVVTGNHLHGTYAAADYVPGTGDSWNGNAASTGYTAAVPS